MFTVKARNPRGPGRLRGPGAGRGGAVARYYGGMDFSHRDHLQNGAPDHPPDHTQNRPLYSRQTTAVATLVALAAALAAPAAGQRPLGKFERELGGLRGPTSVLFIDEETLLVVESEGDRITRVSLAGGDAARTSFGGRGSSDGELISPRAIAVGVDPGPGNIAESPTAGAAAVGSRPSGEAGRPAPATAPTRTSPISGEGDALSSTAPAGNGAAGSAERFLFVTDTGNHRVVVFTLEGRFVRHFGRRGSGPGELVRPAGIAVRGGLVYVADEAAGHVQVFRLDGTFQRTIGRFGTGEGELTRPIDVGVSTDSAADGATGIFVVDADANRVQRFQFDGAPAGRWGDWGTARGLLGEPTGVLVRPEGVYVTEWVNCRVSLFSPDGRFLSAWGAHALRPREGGGKLHYPMRTTIAPSGNRAVLCEPTEDRCQVFTRYAPGETIERVIPPSPDEISSHFGPRAATAADVAVLIDQEGRGVAVYDVTGASAIDIHRFGGVGDEPGNFRRPTAVAVDAKGRKVVVADAGARRLSFFELERPEGPIRQLPDMSRFVRSVTFDALDRRITPRVEGSALDIADLALLPDGGLVCIDALSGRLVVFDAELAFVRVIGEYGDRDGAFLAPETVSVTADGGGAWVVDSRRRCVQLFDVKSGVFQRSVGGDDAGFTEPFGVAATGDGGMFVSDARAATISRFDASGKRVKRWGAPGLGAGEFAKPRDVMIDARGRLLVVDHGNHRVQIFSPGGEFESAFGARLFVVPTLKRPVRP
ncbi:MAG: hypothetical protein AMXMBFR47_04460 [Planctomycetota bacterium]